jgi:TonB family protein
MGNNLFKVSLLISIIVHSAILFRNPNFNLKSLNKKETKLEVSYIKPKAEPEKEIKLEKTAKEKFLKLPPKIRIEKRIPPPFTYSKSIFDKPASIKPDIIAIKKKITLPPIDMAKNKDPLYISYYQTVREKIKRAAYQNYTGNEIGEVTVSFVISSEGYLKDLRIIPEKSHSSQYLKEITLKSIRDASPFPNFPKELDFPQLSFNLAITFEIE